jgi:hypothetical protein
MAHNGIISELSKDEKSDTYVLFKNFVNKFKSLKGVDKLDKPNEERIIESIKSVMDVNGTYSIVLFDKKTKLLYYFKNDYTNIHFYANEKMLYITTSISNEMFLSILNKKFNWISDIKNNIIYRISINDKIHINKVGEIKKSNQYVAGVDYTDSYPYFEEEREGEDIFGRQLNNKDKGLSQYFEYGVDY